MSDPVKHPALDQFRAKMQKRDMTAMNVEAFDKWRSNPEKCVPGSPIKEAADALSSEFLSGGGLPAYRSATAPRVSGALGLSASHANSSTRDDTSNAGAAEPGCLGAPFHNPYTFIPFPDPNWFTGVRARRRPTPLTMDEIEPERFTGVLEIELKTLSPLLTCHPQPVSVSEPEKHKTYAALTVGNDVIVPATGVRGSLRTLMTILAGGTLGYLDDTAWLVQGRDLPLGPRGKAGSEAVPTDCFLARVLKPGTSARRGILRLGRTDLIRADDLEAVCRSSGITPLPRPVSGKDVVHLWADEAHKSIVRKRDPKHPWQIKLSGRPINDKGKREGLFLDDGPDVEIPAAVWTAYTGRNRHGNHPELKEGDLVWIEPADRLATAISGPLDIASIQWARWGRQGERLLDVVREHHSHILPDSLNQDGLVDEVTDLFGQVSMDSAKGAAGPFAGRIRPDNLVFRDAAQAGILRSVPLAPLQPPHPGCAAFYRNGGGADEVSNHGKPLRGYKVYRTTTVHGADAPWLFSSQGVYGNQGERKDHKQKVSKTCDLLAEGQTGTLRLACRSLSKRELGLLLLACSVDWRLGGGKPLGLGHCRPMRVLARDENGDEVFPMIRQDEAPALLPGAFAGEVADLQERLQLWHASQQPVELLRYPRAVSENWNGKQRGGHVWFQRHAGPKKSLLDGQPPKGLQVLWTAGELAARVGKNRIGAQILPRFDARFPQGDVLFGYELFQGDGPDWSQSAGNRQTHVRKLEPYSPETHARTTDHSGGAQGQNRESRQEERVLARAPAQTSAQPLAQPNSDAPGSGIRSALKPPPTAPKAPPAPSKEDMRPEDRFLAELDSISASDVPKRLRALEVTPEGVPPEKRQAIYSRLKKKPGMDSWNFRSLLEQWKPK